MATIVLSAAGAAIGGSVGGSLLGLSSVVVGRFAGAALGRVIDQRLMGQGSAAVEHGRVDRLRLTGVGEGAAIAQVFGRMRVGGHVIWASQFAETVTSSGGGKGAPSRPKTRNFSYSVSLAVALCEGEIAGVLRVWADGVEVAPDELNMRVYPGSRDQLPDAIIEAIEGQGAVPAYRGTAYVVFEDLALERFGNRVPQFSFEVLRPAAATGVQDDPVHNIRGVALMPGTGEYALAVTPVTARFGPGETRSLNINTPSGRSDMETSVAALRVEAPACRAVSLIVSWFGDDLRAGECRLHPQVEQTAHDGQEMPWNVSGMARADALNVPQEGGRVIYGGTPADTSVIEAIRHLADQDQAVMFYPFILMAQLDGNARPDPWTGTPDQPRLPWRGRITGSVAPGQPGSPDGTAAAEAEVARFVGSVKADDFTVTSGQVTYHGPDEWSYSRFILHYAALCAAAGGVDAFCIGSEMRGLTQLRGAVGRFPFVTALRALATECRALLGPQVRIGYAADWSEYFGYQPQDGSGDRYFHLDPLWADPEIDFIGIDNYMPLSDWRDGTDHADASHGAIYDHAYLRGNVEGGEGFDWFYHSDEARAAQIRTPITDGAYGEAWIWRYKDIRNWWLNPHHERIGGVREAVPTPWVPQSKPIWFTELGCPAVDKGTNQPNKFVDPKSSESALPYFSNGRRDELIQMEYLRAVLGYWLTPENNPVSIEYDAPMIDMDRAFVWAWDARPFPFFPGNRTVWADGDNYRLGHWINGRLAGRSLARLIREICARSGISAVDVSTVHGFVRGYMLDDVSDARAALQPLLLAHGLDAVERDGLIRFRHRGQGAIVQLDAARLVATGQVSGGIAHQRGADAEIAGRVRLKFVETDANYDVVAEESILPDEGTQAVAGSDLPLVMTRAEGRQLVERWLSEARVARDTLKFALPPSRLSLGAGDMVALDGKAGIERYRIDRIEEEAFQVLEAVRIEPEIYNPADIEESAPYLTPFAAPVPVDALFLDLPLMRGDEVPHAPHVAVTAIPWPGTVALYSGTESGDFSLNRILAARATIGQTETPLAAGRPGLLHRGVQVQVRLVAGDLQSIGHDALLAGGNLAAIGDGTPEGWELFQFGTAELIGDRTYLLGDLLRGQFGSDGQMQAPWPVGTQFVLLDGGPDQLDLPLAARGQSRIWRYGPARRALDDPSYRQQALAFSGVGLRPLSPVHLRARQLGSGDLAVQWLRRTRIAGDSWDGLDVPIGEETEAYVLRIEQAGILRREVVLGAPAWEYPAAQRAQDTSGQPYRIAVAQVSATVGTGYFRHLDMVD